MTGKKKLKIVVALMAFIAGACAFDAEFSGFDSTGDGTGGSMARFAIANNHLYTVDQSTLKVFDLADPETPQFKNNSQIGFGLETIFPMGDKLFLGTMVGMYIYDVSIASQPHEISYFEHVNACDPVVSDGRFAYVTLSSSNLRCWRNVNELQIVDIQDLSRPFLVKQFPMESPRGLVIRNDTLWVCDNGLRILDVSNKQSVHEMYHFNDIQAYDIILNKNLALVIGETGFTQYEFKNDTIYKLSEIIVQ